MPKSPAELEVRRRIELEGDHRLIEKLCLDEIEMPKITTNIKRLLESCLSLEYVTLNSCELNSLENFPLLPHLITIELVDNQYFRFDIG
jgi:hypothetical protein